MVWHRWRTARANPLVRMPLAPPRLKRFGACTFRSNLNVVRLLALAPAGRPLLSRAAIDIANLDLSLLSGTRVSLSIARFQCRVRIVAATSTVDLSDSRRHIPCDPSADIVPNRLNVQVYQVAINFCFPPLQNPFECCPTVCVRASMCCVCW